MTEPVDVLIFNALLAQLKGAAGTGLSDVSSPATPLASPLVTFAPAAQTPYLDARPILRAQPDSPGLAYNSSTTRRGIFQVDAVIPDGQGEPIGIRLAALVAARFAQGTTLIAGTRLLKCNSVPTIAAAVKDAPWVRFPVSIPYTIVS